MCSHRSGSENHSPASNHQQHQVPEIFPAVLSHPQYNTHPAGVYSTGFFLQPSVSITDVFYHTVSLPHLLQVYVGVITPPDHTPWGITRPSGILRAAR